jgi:hypothetical protein
MSSNEGIFVFNDIYIKTQMSKLIITQKQYDTLLLREHKTRLLINEASDEVVLSVALLIGVKLTGQNESRANKALKDESILNKIKSTIETEKDLKELIKQLEEKGLKDVEDKFIKKADSFIDNYNKYVKTNKMDFMTKSKLIDLDK